MNINGIAALPARYKRRFRNSAALGLLSLFRRPPRVQFAALCYRRGTKEQHQILLITSRDTGRWVIPKGWPMEGRSAGETAAREAYEEAGIRGTIADREIGRYAYAKTMRGGLRIRCNVQVHPLAVERCETDFPESRQRTLRWFTPDEAAARVKEPGLKAIIRAFNP